MLFTEDVSESYLSRKEKTGEEQGTKYETHPRYAKLKVREAVREIFALEL